MQTPPSSLAAFAYLGESESSGDQARTGIKSPVLFYEALRAEGQVEDLCIVFATDPKGFPGKRCEIFA